MQRIVTLFPLWVLVASLPSLYYPPLFTWFSGSLIPIGLGIIMLWIGITLQWEDFARIGRIPGVDSLGLLWSTVQVIIIPVLLGLALRQWIPARTK